MPTEVRASLSTHANGLYKFCSYANELETHDCSLHMQHAFKHEHKMNLNSTHNIIQHQAVQQLYWTHMIGCQNYIADLSQR